jgi:heme exporter protein B
MSAFGALVARELKLAFRAGGEAMVLVLFFVMVGVIVPFAVGPDRPLLTRLAPGIVWIAAFLSTLLGLDRLFRADDEDGSLTLLRHARLPLEAIVFGKLVAHWLVTAVPLLLATPILALLLNMSLEQWGRTALALLIGTPALTAFGALGASVTVGLRRGGLVAPVLILPLAIPVMIFGVGMMDPLTGGGATLFLLALSLVVTAFSPFAAALALRTSGE